MMMASSCMQFEPESTSTTPQRRKRNQSKSNAATDDAIEKLNTANEALRNQLRMVTKALESHIDHNSKPQQDDDDDFPQSNTNNLQQKAHQLKNAQKKIKQYKRENMELQRKLQALNSADRVASLESQSQEKQQVRVLHHSPSH